MNRSLICIVVTVFFLLHVAGAIEIPLVNKFENTVYDLRLKLNTVSTVDPRIVIIDIDEKSLANEGRWPWSRDKLAYLTDLLFDYYQVSVIGFDVVFAEPDTSSGIELLEKIANMESVDSFQFKSIIERLRPQLVYDELFAASLKNRPVVLGYYFNSSSDNINPSSALPYSDMKQKDSPNLRLTPEAGFGANLAILQKAAIYGGYFNNSHVDSDGIFRRLPLITSFDGYIYESLSLAIYRRLLGQPPVKFMFGENYAGQKRLEGINIESLTIPVNENGVALVPYRGRQGSFNYISATDVLSAKIHPEDLADKIVLIGSTAVGIMDLHSTPVQNVYPGVEIHANLISGMLDQSFKSKPTYMIGAQFIELVLLALFIIFLYPRLSSISALFTLVFLISLIIWSNIYFWNHFKIDVFLATPLILLFFLYSIQIYFGYFLESKKRSELSKVFGQYIPKKLVADMSKSDHEYSLKGESKELTVLFSDVRGFTSISEKISPDELCVLINEILTPITKVIHENHGTIDKYIGDAVMAFWGAPIDDERHAYHSVKAALEFLPALDLINESFQKKGWPYIDLGIGLNTGLMNVGNMGSEFRIAYTVMGDSVNLGSRLEGLTKQYKVQIIVGESTKEAAPEFSYIELDRVKVKGKLKPVTIYEPLGLVEEISEQTKLQIEKFNQALNHYHNKDWSTTQVILNDLLEQYPDRYLFQLYLDRIKNYIDNPPAADWDGVFTYQTK